MNIAELKNILSDMDIELTGLHTEARLGADLGMDSQEIVELRAVVDRRFDIKVPAKSLTKASTVQQVLDCVATAKAAHTKTSHCEASLVIKASAERAYAALHNLSEWTRHLPHVLAVDVLYDDGKFQEFKMDVASKNGLLRVRSIRRCVVASKEIEFFQPEPPKFLHQHAGGWRFLQLDDGSCRVVTYHDWAVNRVVAAEVYAGTETEQDAAIYAQLLEHANFALSCWQKQLEGETGAQPNMAARFVSSNDHEARAEL